MDENDTDTNTEIIDEQSELLKAYEEFQRQQKQQELEKQNNQEQSTVENNLMDINELLNFNQLESRIS